MKAKNIAQITLIALCLALTGALASLAASSAPTPAVATAPAATAAPAPAPSVDNPRADTSPALDKKASAPETPVVSPLFQEPIKMFGCSGPGCNDSLDCRHQGIICPLGEFQTCFNSTGNCDGDCGCS